MNYVSVVSACTGITYENSHGEWTLRAGSSAEYYRNSEAILRSCFGKYCCLDVTIHKAYNETKFFGSILEYNGKMYKV